MNCTQRSAEGATEYSPERSAAQLGDRTSQDGVSNVLGISAEGATDYSPERSAAQLRDYTASAPNPCQGVTETVGRPMRGRLIKGAAFRRPFSGALSGSLNKPGVSLRFTPGFNPPRPSGAGKRVTT